MKPVTVIRIAHHIAWTAMVLTDGTSASFQAYQIGVEGRTTLITNNTYLRESTAISVFEDWVADGHCFYGV